MLDDLLGRTALQERITELEETLKQREDERDRLEQQLEAERERRSDAVTERQAAQRRVNKLEDRITQLEDRLDRLQSETTELSVRRETTLRGDRLAAVLDRLESFKTGPEGALTAAVADGRDLPAAVGETLGDRAGLVSRAAPCIVVADDASLVSACLRPPVQPAPFVEWGPRFRLDREWFQPHGRYTLAVVRSDLFAMGTYQADEPDRVPRVRRGHHDPTLEGWVLTGAVRTTPRRADRQPPRPVPGRARRTRRRPPVSGRRGLSAGGARRPRAGGDDDRRRDRRSRGGTRGSL
jgi:Chromosome segregation ATPases